MKASMPRRETTYDQQSQGWIFARCVHALSLGALQRTGLVLNAARNLSPAPSSMTGPCHAYHRRGQGDCEETL